MAYYDTISPGYNELYEEEQIKKLKLIKTKIKIKANSKLLDVGCGSGISSDFECFAVGIDPSMELLKINKSGKKILGIAEALPFKDSSFDYVISITSLHNFFDVRKSIREMLRVGKNYFVLSILKKSKDFNKIRKLINGDLRVYDVMEEEKDLVFFCSRP